MPLRNDVAAAAILPNEKAMKKIQVLLLVALLACFSCGGSDEQVTPTSPVPEVGPGTDDESGTDDEPGNDQNPEPTEKPLKIIRMIVLADPYKQTHWMANKAHGLSKDYTAQDIIEMIEEIKPDWLERFVTGQQNPNDLVPVRAGHPPMTVLEFLNACILAGSERCQIVPKLNLEWFFWNSEKLFWDSAQNLYDLPLVRPIRNINLDVWSTYTDRTTEEERTAMFKRLREIGYTEIGMNYTGKININHPEIDYGDFTITKDEWKLNEFAVARLKSYPNLKYIHLYIDYPHPMEEFMQLPVDRQADIYCNEIYPKQFTMGYTYVYPIIQDAWDATEHYTLITGPYKGKSMYDITLELLNKSQK